MKLETQVQHVGSCYRIGDGLIGATENSVTFRTEKIDDIPVYSRLGNTKNHAEVESVIAALHKAPSALVFGSGMAVMTSVLMTFLKPGDHILAQEGCYGGNFGLLTQVFNRFGIEVSFLPIQSWAKGIRPTTKLCYFESISNPFCVPQDIHFAVAFAKGNKLLTLCDNTFASPYNVTPLQIGVDLVMESATKYLNGHSDLVCGVLAGSQSLIDQTRHTSKYLGGFLSTEGCTHLLRGLKTFAVRMECHNRNGQLFSESISSMPFVSDVYYGLPKRRNFQGYGGMCTVRFKSSAVAWASFLKLISNVPSLGGTETTITLPRYTTNSMMTDDERQFLGIDDRLVRFSIGLEDINDILDDVKQAAARAGLC